MNSNLSFAGQLENTVNILIQIHHAWSMQVPLKLTSVLPTKYFTITIKLIMIGNKHELERSNICMYSLPTYLAAHCQWFTLVPGTYLKDKWLIVIQAINWTLVQSKCKAILSMNSIPEIHRQNGKHYVSASMCSSYILECMAGRHNEMFQDNGGSICNNYFRDIL